MSKITFINTMRILILFILTIIIFRQNIYSEEAQNFQFEKVSHLDNLPNNEILSLYQDSDGFIWLATTGGLYQFDGYDLTEYRSNVYNFNLLTHNRITCLKEDEQKNLYIGTNEGLNILNKKNRAYNKKANIRNFLETILPALPKPQKEKYGSELTTAYTIIVWKRIRAIKY